ncbi:Potassium/sodium hyperpolarization-activated cyclic nucleotide-gated channel 4, partial [Tetrabaena socialis]
MYFILKGTVAISDETGSLLTRLAQGSHFGEFGILAYLDGQLGVRTAAARADDCVEVYKLHCEDFASLADYYPELVDFFRDVAV